MKRIPVLLLFVVGPVVFLSLVIYGQLSVYLHNKPVSATLTLVVMIPIAYWLKRIVGPPKKDSRLRLVNDCAKPIGEVVFVHGLGGDAETTWVTDEGRSSWAKWLLKDRPDLRVWSFGYPASGLSWFGSSMHLPNRAVNFLTILRNEKFGENPICFITHSLGGLVVKQLLFEAMHFPPDSNKLLAEKVRGVVFIATPHIGSPLATLIYKLRFLTRPTSAIADLMPSHWLQKLNSWYRNYVIEAKTKSLVFRENRPTKGIVTVVDFISSDAGIHGADPIDTDFDHIEICKPKDKKNIVYSTTLRFLEEVFGTREIFHVPYEVNKYFTNREEVISKIRKRFLEGESMQSLSGVGGIGKTQTALKYAYHFSDKYRAVFWARAQSRETLVTDYVNWAGDLNLGDKNAPEQIHAVNAMKEWLNRNNSWLLILDNADDLAMAEEFTGENMRGHVLFTTQAQGIGKGLLPSVVPSWGRQEGALFLLRRLLKISLVGGLDEASGDMRRQAEDLSELLYGLPLALDQAAAFILESPSTLVEYISLLQTERQALLSKRGQYTNGHKDSVAATFSMSFRKVAGINRATVDLLRLCAFLDADEIPEEIFLMGAEVLGDSLREVASNKLKMIETVQDCRRFSLLERNPEAQTLRIHRLVQIMIREEMWREDQCIWAKRAVLAVNKTFPSTDFINWEVCGRLIQHVLTLAKYIDEYDIAIPEAARLLNRAGGYLKDHARYAEALPLYQQSLAIYEKALGPEHRHVATALNNFALFYQSMGKYEEVESLYKRSLSIYEKELNPEDKKIAAALNNLAMLYSSQKRYTEAEQLYIRCIEKYENALGPDNPELAKMLSNLAELYDSLKEYDKSAPLHIRSLIIMEKELGSEHPVIANTLNNLAGHYYSLGLFAEAENYYMSSLKIYEKALGAKHPTVATLLCNVAELYQTRGNYSKAESNYKRALEIFKKALGPDHPDVAKTYESLAAVCKSQGKHAKAETYKKRALEILEKASGPKSRR